MRKLCIAEIILVVSLALYTAPGVLAAGPVRLQIVDTLESKRVGSGWNSELVRKIGIGKDSKDGAGFDAVLINALPAGSRLLSPKPGKMQLQAVNGRKCPVVFTSTKKGSSSELRYALSGIPTLPQGRACCACDGSCGRACSLEFSYRTTYPGDASRWGSVSYTSKGDIRIGKSGLVDININIPSLALKDAAAAVTVPDKINGARISLKSYSKAFSASKHSNGTTRLVTKRGIKGGKYQVRLQITPSRSGSIVIPGFIEVIGKTDQPISKAPLLSGGLKAVVDHKGYIKLRSDASFTAK